MLCTKKCPFLKTNEIDKMFKYQTLCFNWCGGERHLATGICSGGCSLQFVLLFIITRWDLRVAWIWSIAVLDLALWIIFIFFSQSYITCIPYRTFLISLNNALEYWLFESRSPAGTDFLLEARQASWLRPKKRGCCDTSRSRVPSFVAADLR